MRDQKENESRVEYLLQVAAEYIRTHRLEEYPVTYDGCRTEDAFSLLDSLEDELPRD